MQLYLLIGYFLFSSESLEKLGQSLLVLPCFSRSDPGPDPAG
jgi:hypothetical protein